MKRPDGFDIKPGHYLQLRVPSIKRYEWHDFSLTGMREGNDLIVLKIKTQGDWTDDLFNLLNGEEYANLVVDIRGAFASPAARPTKEDQWLMIAGGIGVTPFLGFMHTMVFNASKIKQFHLVWVLRDSRLLSWLEPFLTSPLIGGGKVHIYLTQGGECSDLPGWLQQGAYGDVVVISQTRPDWEKLFDTLSKDLTQPHCFVCGPDGMTNAVATQCREKGWGVSVEKF